MPYDDLGASLWLAVFAQSLAEHPELWHFIDVTQERSERITALAAAFDKALAIAHSPLSNSKPNIRAKTLARNEAVKAVREVVNAIKAAPELTQSQIWNFGIDPRKIVDKRPRAKKSQKALLPRRKTLLGRSKTCPGARKTLLG